MHLVPSSDRTQGPHGELGLDPCGYNPCWRQGGSGMLEYLLLLVWSWCVPRLHDQASRSAPCHASSGNIIFLPHSSNSFTMDRLNFMMSWAEEGIFAWKHHVFVFSNYMKAYVSMYFLHLMLTFPPQTDVMVNGPLSMLFPCIIYNTFVSACSLVLAIESPMQMCIIYLKHSFNLFNTGALKIKCKVSRALPTSWSSSPV